MTIPDYQSLMLPVLRIATDGEVRVAVVADRVGDELGLTQEERAELLPSGRQPLLHNRIYWAKFYMSKAGLIASPGRGRFLATEAGRALLDTKPDRISVSVLMRYSSFQEFHRGESASSDEQDNRAVCERRLHRRTDRA